MHRVLAGYPVASRGPPLSIQEPHQGLLIGYRPPLDALKELLHLPEVVNLFDFVAFYVLLLSFRSPLWGDMRPLLVRPHGCLELCLEILIITPLVSHFPLDVIGLDHR